MDAGVGIDLRGLNSVSFNYARDRVFIGGGVSNGELIEAAYAAEMQVRKSMPRTSFTFLMYIDFVQSMEAAIASAY